MKQKTYQKMTDFFRRPGWPSTVLFILKTGIPILIACIYLAGCLYFLLTDMQILIRYACVPLIGFLFITVLRKIINRKRPYEVYDYQPLKNPDHLKQGQSFPSRHSGSAALIAMAIMAYSPLWLGILMIVLAILTALSRLLAGLHYPSDVFAGLAIGFGVGFIGFYPVIF